MAPFKDLATRYVLSDEEKEMHEASYEAAQALQSSRETPTAFRVATQEWVTSVGQWIVQQDSDMDDGDETGNVGNVVLRSKALSFLEETLAALSSDIFKADQIQVLTSFFCSIFRNDIRAGVMPATKALRRLAKMPGFRPRYADEIVQSIAKIGDDFPLQTVATRLEIYQLLAELVANPVIAGELQHTHGEAAGFILDLVSLCRQERDPKCLMEWFALLELLLDQFPMSPEVTEEVFKSFSAYFPISLKNPAGEITAADLKLALRKCFAAHHRLAGLSFPFLVKKLDQGDGVTVSVKLDILQSLKMCIEKYAHVATSIDPFTSQIWNSLKYEVRNGEVQETIAATLDVISALSRKLDGTGKQKFPEEGLLGFMKTVMGDCIDDLSNPTYTRPAGSLLVAAMGTNPRAFIAAKPQVFESLFSITYQTKSPSHAKDILHVLNEVLQARKQITDTHDGWIGEDYEAVMKTEFQLNDNIFERIYLRLWRDNMIEQPTKDNVGILKEIMLGLALLVGQMKAEEPGMLVRVFGDARVTEICSLLSYRIVNSLAISSANDSPTVQELEEEATKALKQCMVSYPQGFGDLTVQAMAILKGRDWQKPSPRSLDTLQALLFRLADIGCSDVPLEWLPMGNFLIYTAFLLQLLYHLFVGKANFEVCRLVLLGLQTAMANFEAACDGRGLRKISGSLAADRVALLQDLESVLPAYPRIDSGNVDEFQPQAILAKSGLGSGKDSIFSSYQKVSFLIVFQLFRRAVSFNEVQNGTTDNTGSVTLSSDFSSGKAALAAENQYLQVLAAIAAFMIRGISEQSQKDLRLERETLGLFTLEGDPEPVWTSADGGRTNILSLGVLLGLWPSSVTDLCKLGVFSVSTIVGKPTEEELPDLTEEVRDRIAVVLSNKYRGGPSTADPDSSAWSGILQHLKLRLGDDEIGSVSLPEFSRLMSIVGGAIARRDRHIESLAELVRSAPARGPLGEHMARIMDVLVAPKTWYSKRDLAVIKPTYRHWAYAMLVQPVLTQAYPLQPAAAASLANTVYVLSMVQHLPFDVYENDAPSIARVVIAAMGRLKLYYDLKATFQVLLTILRNNKETFEGHLKAIADGAWTVYSQSRVPSVQQQDPNVPRRFQKVGSAPACRKLALEVVGFLPGNFATAHLLPFAPALIRGLSTACGDPVRDVRAAALLARRAWANVS